MATGAIALKPGMVVEWFTKGKLNPKTGLTEPEQHHEVVAKPKCANSGQVEYAGFCSCAPDLEEWAAAQAEGAKQFFWRSCDDKEEVAFWFEAAERLAQLFIS